MEGCTKNKRILLVEDDPSTRFLLSEMVDELGYDCDQAQDGRDCLRQINDDPGRYDLILMDIHMPAVSGLEASHSIRTAETDPPRSIPIIAVTADAQWHSRPKCRAAGFDDVVGKPVTMKNLDIAIRNLSRDAR